MKNLAYILMIIIGFAGMAKADLFLVEGVPVSATAENAVAAKEVALNEAGNKAFKQLMQKIVLSSDAGNIEADPAEIVRLIQGFSVAHEKTTATKYMADVSVQFKPKEVQEFMKAKGLPFLAKMPPKFVFIPLFREGSMAQVFDEASPLFQSVKVMSPNSSVYQFVVPTGDLEDMSVATPMVLTGVDMAPLAPLLQKYGTEYALVLRVTKNGSIYKVEALSYPENSAAGAGVTFAVSSGSEDVQGVMGQIVKKATSEMEKKWKAYQVEHGTQQNELTVIFPINGLSEWSVLEKRLKGLPFLDQVNVQALHQNKVFVKVVAAEEIETLIQKMKKAGFPLVKQYDATWIWEKEVPVSENAAIQAGMPLVSVSPVGGVNEIQ